MRVIIGNGKVASVLRKSGDFTLTHSDIEVSDDQSVKKSLSSFPQGTVVINTAAKINLEWCEVNKKECESVNYTGAINVSRACIEFGHRLVHISSGCIFDGMTSDRVYSEADTPSPAAWYTKMKAEADEVIFEENERATIVRPRQLISSVPNVTNMITKFMSMDEGRFIDSKNSLTCIEDMSQMIDHLVDNHHYGIFNLANSGFISPYEVALSIKEHLKPGLKVTKTSYEDYVKTLGVKRVNTLLDITKLKSTGYTPRSAKEALFWCVNNYGKTKSV
jgi:dTDP-4-dehydrorhamnose reductase